MNITPEKTTDAVRAAVEAAFPGERIYVDVTPENFQRPCSLVELVKLELDTRSLGRSLVGLRYQYKLTTFSEVDQVHNSHLPVLDLRAMALLGAFASGYVPVEDRAMQVTALTADTSLYDCAVVTLALELAVAREAYCPAELLPAMRELSTRYITKEETNHE